MFIRLDIVMVAPGRQGRRSAIVQKVETLNGVFFLFHPTRTEAGVFEEIVFAGVGEPLERWPVVREVR